MPVRVKICGLTNLDDARSAIDSGADALGFIFFSSSARYVTPAAAARIIAQLPPFVTKVGVFADERHDAIHEIANETGIDTIQLHGSETPELAEAFGVRFKVVKGFRVKDQNTVEQMKNYRTAAFLLDSFVPGKLGGTGAKFNWELAVEAKALGTPIILAGGLGPENVRDAILKVAPYGVDVSSGVESEPGKKDLAKVRAFIRNAKQTS